MLTRESNIKNWNRLHGDRAERSGLEEELYQVWDKSEKLGIDPGGTLPEELTAQEFSEIIRSYKRLMTCSDWVINHVIENSADSDLRVLLFSREGVLLRIYGEAFQDDWLRERGVKCGAMWTEESIGANILSMGLRKKSHYEMSGDLNFARFLVDGDYYYAPICLTENDISASLVLAIPEKKSDAYLRTVAVTVARSVELDMFAFQSVEMFTSGDEDNGSIFFRLDEDKYKVVLITDQVFKILGIKKTDSYHLTLDQLILPPPENKELWNIISNRRTVTDKTMALSVIGGRRYVNVTTNTYKRNKFHPDGYTIFLSPGVGPGKAAPRYTDNNARYTFSDIIGENERMLDTVKRGQIAALSDSNILIQGESGVGKDVFAQAIHNASSRSHKPFVAINCAAFSKELISSELFGYESGAFTGAKREGSIGKFELANHGTLFLDEIGDMPLEVQSVLLRVLEEKTFRKVGGNRLIEVDVRIIAATNKNLKELIEKKQFREDLFYRLSVIRVNIPPLRDRGDDVYLFSDFIIKKLCDRMGRPEVRLTEQALDFLGRYSWPGNIRELQNLLEGIISTHEGAVIGEEEINNYLGEYFREPRPEELLESAPASPAVRDIFDMGERERFELALKKCRNNKTRAAEYLGLSRSTFYRRLREFGMN